MPVTLNVQQTVPFVIQLPATPTTGYVWQLGPHPDTVQVLESSFQGATAGPGHEGLQLFHLRIDQAGEYNLTFVLKRAWESVAIKEMTYRVNVLTARQCTP